MLTIKIIGVLMILSVGGIAAYGEIKYEKRVLCVLDEWIDLIRHIRSQIDRYLTPLNEIMEECLEKGMTLERLYRSTSVYLDGTAKHHIEGFTKDIGGGYREDQLKLCDFCIEELRCRRASHAAQLPTRLKLSVTLTVCITLGTAILLW